MKRLTKQEKENNYTKHTSSPQLNEGKTKQVLRFNRKTNETH